MAGREKVCLLRPPPQLYSSLGGIDLSSPETRLSSLSRWNRLVQVGGKGAGKGCCLGSWGIVCIVCLYADPGATFMISYVSCLQHAINFLGVHAGATAVISHPWLSTFTIQTLVPGLRQAGASGRGSSLRSPYEHDFWMSLKDWQGPVHA